LPEGVTPLSYDLTLDVDPDSETFRGEVRIRVHLDKATDRVWLHMVDLDLQSASYEGKRLEPLNLVGDQMRAFSFGRTLAPRNIELSFAYIGHATKDQQGLFRQRAAARSYLFSQGQAVFARRITPCFDEPRFKTPWRVTLIVPREQVALANEREERVEVIDTKQKRVVFARTRPMPSYLLAIAVGPFDVVETGSVGRNKLRVRVAVRAGAGKLTPIVAEKLPAIVGALETYMDDALPLTKLDLVGVPHLFGAMENPGLITFDESMLLGSATRKRFATMFVTVAAHELVHQWFGNSVTPAWWDDLWLSEAFASWLGDKIASELRAVDNPLLEQARARHEATLDPNPTALRRSIANNVEADANFDYSKGEVVLATIEAWLGPERFRDALRKYVRTYRERTATTDDFLASLGDPDARLALQQFATMPGLPVVELELRCKATPVVVATARDQRAVPICITYAGGARPICALAKQSTEVALPSCPSWVIGNALAGYYHVASNAPRPALANVDAPSRIVIADDIAASITRGEIAAKPALAELRAFADTRDELGAIAIARAIDRFVDDATRPTWTRWLAARFTNQVQRGPQRGIDLEIQSALLALLPADRFPPARVKLANQYVERSLARDALPYFDELSLAAAVDPEKLFSRILDKARATQDASRRAEWLELLGAFPAAYAERVAQLAIDYPELPIEPIWAALQSYFERPTTRTAAWRALKPRLHAFKRIATLADAVSQLCDATSRDDVAKSHLPTTAIDRCIARRAHLGDLSAAIAASP